MRFRFLIAATAMLVASACAQDGLAFERKINGKTAAEIFSDSKVVGLARAACSGDERGVAREIAAGANPNAVGYVGAVPLLWAIRCHSAAGVEALLKAGANPNYMMDGDFSPTYAAAQEPLPILQALLRHGGDPNAGSNESGRSALIEAMSMGINGVGWDNYYALLDAGADVNRVYKPYNTIGHFAAAMAQYDKLIELLNRGFDRDLDYLGAFVQARVIRPDLEPKRAQVKAMLEARGVHFPVPPMRAPGT